MQIRFQNSPVETKQMTTEQLRQNFLIDGLMHPGTIQLTYSHYDRMIVGGVMPTDKPINLPKEEELKANYFLERREMGIINVGGKGFLMRATATSAIPLSRIPSSFAALRDRSMILPFT